MKLLLTSAGLTNRTLERHLEELTGKPAEATKLVHIPTATMVDAGNKHALMDEFNHLRGLGYEVDILDIAGKNADIWRPRLEAAEVIYMSGGNVYWLNAQLQASGVAAALPDLLKTRVYVGASAGSTVACRYFTSDLAQYFGEEDEAAMAPATQYGLELVDFMIRAHYNNPSRPERIDAWYQNVASHVDYPVYALDDQSAIVVADTEPTVIGEGQWKRFN